MQINKLVQTSIQRQKSTQHMIDARDRQGHIYSTCSEIDRQTDTDRQSDMRSTKDIVLLEGMKQVCHVALSRCYPQLSHQHTVQH